MNFAKSPSLFCINVSVHSHRPSFVFQLSGGACTAALLQVLYADHQMPNQSMTWVAVLRKMRTVLRGMGYDQVPQLTSSRLIDVNKEMYIVPPGSTGAKRAVLVGINYVGQKGQLSGCHNDVRNVKQYLENALGFRDQDMLVLMDDGRHHAPTRQNILNAYKRVGEYSKPGDCVFIHYSGHGGRLVDQNGDEDDGYDETLIPVDFQQQGQIRDDDLLRILVKPLPEGCTMTCLMDCCHSGTVLDLPYRFTADGDKMVRNSNMNFDKFATVAEGAVIAGCCLFYLLNCLMDF